MTNKPYKYLLLFDDRVSEEHQTAVPIVQGEILTFRNIEYRVKNFKREIFRPTDGGILTDSELGVVLKEK